MTPKAENPVASNLAKPDQDSPEPTEEPAASNLAKSEQEAESPEPTEEPAASNLAKSEQKADSPEQPDDLRLAELARLSPIEYDRRREDASKEMGIRVTTLDAEVEQQRKVMTAAEVEQPVDLNPRMSEQEAASTEPEEEIVEFIPAKSESVASTDPTYDPLLSELASMSRIEYDRRREDAAKQMEIRVATLDAEIELRRKTMALGTTMEPKFLADIDPWEVAVDGSDLLDEIANALLKYVVLPDGALEAIVLWIVHAHAHDAAQVSPILAITSPEKRCGKTTLLSAIYNVCPRALPTSNITVASLFRVVEAYRPTVLIDEADTFLSDNDALRGVLNSGHNRSQAYVLRTVGDDHEPKQFATWSPKSEVVPLCWTVWQLG